MVVVATCCTARSLCVRAEFNGLNQLSRVNSFHYLSKSKSHRLRTSSSTDLLRCGKSDESISMAFCDTRGAFDGGDDVLSGFFEISSCVGRG